jgi:hypothetical protein
MQLAHGAAPSAPEICHGVARESSPWASILSVLHLIAPAVRASPPGIDVGLHHSEVRRLVFVKDMIRSAPIRWDLLMEDGLSPDSVDLPEK